MTTDEATHRPLIHRRPQRGFLAQWDRHPAVASGEQLTLGERAADKMRNGMGSWNFVFVFLAAMALWAFVNTILGLGHGFSPAGGFDPYPYILLNLFLSMVAGLQGAILLIAAKRSDQIASQPRDPRLRDRHARLRADRSHPHPPRGARGREPSAARAEQPHPAPARSRRVPRHDASHTG